MTHVDIQIKILFEIDNNVINQKLKHTFQHGKTSLHRAVETRKLCYSDVYEGRNKDVMKLILQSGADANMKDEVDRLHRYIV